MGASLSAALALAACGDAAEPSSDRVVDPVAVFAVPAGSDFADAVVVSLEADRPARIVYTRDGSLPSASSSSEYTGPMRLTESTLLTFMAIADDGSRSQVVEEWYEKRDARPLPVEMPAKSVRLSPDRLVFTPEPGVEKTTEIVSIQSIGREPVTVFALSYGPAGSTASGYDPEAFQIVPGTTDPVIPPGESVDLAITYFTTRTSRSMVLDVETDAENVPRGVAPLFLFGRMFD
jgi:hypothetical protein